MPLCFGRGRVGPRQQRAPLRELRGGGPDLLAGDAPAAVDPGGLGGQAGQVGSGARLGKQLAPDHFAAERRRQEALLLLLGAERDDRRDDPGRDADLRPLDPAAGELLGDDDLLDRAGGAAPRLGQVRQHPAALGDARPCAARASISLSAATSARISSRSFSVSGSRSMSIARMPVVVAVSTTCCG